MKRAMREVRRAPQSPGMHLSSRRLGVVPNVSRESGDAAHAGKTEFITPSALRLALIVILTFITTAAVVQYSFRKGRLAIPPAFDDVGYMADAATRTAIFWHAGLPGFAGNFLRVPPHSPYSTLMGVAAFLIFGVRDWAPYVMNAVVVLGYLLFADYVLRGVRFWPRAICFLFLLCIPLVGEAVYEFRPDHISALITVAACMMLLDRSILGASRLRLIRLGVLFGLATLTKPSTFPAVIILLAACMGLSAAADCLGSRRPFRAAAYLRSWAILVTAAAVFVLPYFALDLRAILSYIYDNFFGSHSQEWKFQGTLVATFTYDLTGAGGNAMLGSDLLVLLALLAAAAAVCLHQRDRGEIFRMAAFALLLFATFMMGVMNHMKSIFTGLVFHTCLVFLAIQALAYLFQKPVSRRWAAPIAAVAAAWVVYHFTWPAPWGDYNGVMSSSRRQMASGIFNTMVTHEVPGHNHVLIQGIGDINHALFAYMSVKEQQDLVFDALPDSDEIAPAVAQWDRFDFIVASQQGTRVTADFLLRYRTLDELLNLLKKRPDFREIGFFPFALSGKGYYVFQKVRPSDAPE